MTSVPSELNAASVIAAIDSGAYPPDVVATIARGFLPLGQEDLIAVLAHLMTSADPENAGLARISMSEIPSRSILAFANNESIAPDYLATLARASYDTSVLEALIRNRSLTDDVVIELAASAEPALQEVIVINQARIIRAPRILEVLLENPSLSAEARRRALENREEFFDKKARAQAELAAAAHLMEEDLVDAPLDAIADLLEKAEIEPEPETSTLPEMLESDKKDVARQSIFQKLLHMGVAEKVQLAFKGDKTVRMILVRERNKLVCSATMRNPRMTDTEVESIAGMRNVEEEVLRLIGMRREWMTKYPIIIQLVRNPKSPIGIVLPLINRLTLRDLKTLKDDKGVSEVVRATARKFFQARQQKS